MQRMEFPGAAVEWLDAFGRGCMQACLPDNSTAIQVDVPSNNITT